MVDDGELATARVALSAPTEIGLVRVVGSQRAWINVTREFLVEGLVHSLPPERVVLELLEEQLIDERLLEQLGKLRAAGYVLALDDFRLTPEYVPEAMVICSAETDSEPQRGQGIGSSSSDVTYEC